MAAGTGKSVSGIAVAFKGEITRAVALGTRSHHQLGHTVGHCRFLLFSGC